MGGFAISKARRLWGMMAARFGDCPKAKPPARWKRLRASVQSPSSAVAKALGAILAPTLTPCTRCLYVQHLGPFTTSPPVAARLGIVGVGH